MSDATTMQSLSDTGLFEAFYGVNPSGKRNAYGAV